MPLILVDDWDLAQALATDPTTLPLVLPLDGWLPRGVPVRGRLVSLVLPTWRDREISLLRCLLTERGAVLRPGVAHV